MTMHLEGPWLSLTGKKKSKVKYRSSAQKQRSLLLKAEWEKKQKEWAKLNPTTKKTVSTSSKEFVYKLTPPPGRETTQHIPSRDSGIGVAIKKDSPVYTGDKMIGIATMHKSNAVPVFSDSSAKDISAMRR